jgi:hypothetical protein
MAEEEHRKKIEKKKEHKAAGSGCVTRCQGSKYVKGNDHSHRWNAAQQARGRKDVYTIDLDTNAKIPHWGVQALRRLGAGLVSGVAGKIKKHAQNQLEPFYRTWWPFPHNAHHIVPVGVLWKEVIDAAVARVDDSNKQKMFDEVIRCALVEPYNHNHQPNMITLPTRNKESVLLGLPIHLQGKKRDHPDYTKPIAAQVKAELPPKYDALVSAVDQKKHVTQKEQAVIEPELKHISETVYSAIIELAKTKKLAGQSLDQAADAIAELAAQIH